VKKIFLLIVLFVVSAFSANAQTLAQPPKLIRFYSYLNPQQTYTFPIFSSAKAGDTLFAFITPGSGIAVTDPQETWTLVPGTTGLWTATASGNTVTVTISFSQVSYVEAIFADYSASLVLDQAAQESFGTGTSSLSFSITPKQANDLVLGYGWNGTTNYDSLTGGTGYTLEAFDNAIYFEDQIQSAAGPITSSASWSSPVGWYQGVAAFKLAVAPLPVVTLPVTGSLLFDAGGAVYIGTINVQQWNGSVGVPAGTLASDANGVLTGTLTANPNFVDANGNLNFAFSLNIPNVPNGFNWAVPVQEIQQGSTGLVVNEVLFQQPFMTKLLAITKSFSISLVP
jgi:hypothetical protein